MIQAGKLRHRIDIQEQSITRDSVGGEVISWSNVSTAIPAMVEPLSMNEVFRAQQSQSQITMRVKIRYQSGIDPKMRLVYNSENYDIESIINPDFRNRELVLLCSRVNT